MAYTLKRIAFLYSRLSGYTAACIKELKQNFEVDVLIFRWPESQNAPFEKELFDISDQNHLRTNQSSKEIINILRQFDPQGIYVSGWLDRGYLKAARTLKQRGVPVISGMDAQWQGTLRQRIGCFFAHWLLHSAIDAMWVPGERQRIFARKLGYKGKNCLYGMYACNWEQFAQVMSNRTNGAQPSFLFVGRYVALKGIDLLVQAYKHYRNQVQNPWPLICAGTGPLGSLLVAENGIEDRGFVQPDALPDLMEEASAFVLPSRKEPWGVVVQEAAASGMPIICSEASGAGVHLVQDGYNGFLFENNNAKHLAECMVRLHDMSPEQRAFMGKRSHELSKQFTPQRWAETLIHGIETLAHETSSRR